MVWAQPGATSVFPCGTEVTCSPGESDSLEDVSVPCPCANAGQSERPITVLHHQEPLGKGQTGPAQPESIVHVASPPTVSREAPCTGHALPQGQANFIAIISPRKALLHLEERWIQEFLLQGQSQTRGKPSTARTKKSLERAADTYNAGGDGHRGRHVPASAAEQSWPPCACCSLCLGGSTVSVTMGQCQAVPASRAPAPS